MKTKNVLALLLACVMSFTLVACGGIETTQNAQSEEKILEESDQKPTEVKEKIFVDDESCMFKISDIDPDDIWGYTLKADLENKTDKNLMFSFENVSVNGYMCDPFWATTVQGGKKAKSDISFSSDELSELGIETVEEIEFTLVVYDDDDWTAPHYVEETFTYVVGE